MNWPSGIDFGATVDTLQLTLVVTMLSEEAFRNFFTYYKGQPQQVRGVNELWSAIRQQCPELLDPKHHWVGSYREKPPADQIGLITNDWDGIKKAADIAGARWPECVAAQWALESAWGKHTSGKNNFFGIKGSGTSCQTWEDYGSGAVTITAEFKDFDSIQDCICYLVDRWYLDYKGYQGVNRAASREECARLLKSEGYATDPLYPEKLIEIMERQS